MKLAENEETVNYLSESLAATLPPKQDGISEQSPLTSEWKNYIGSPASQEFEVNVKDYLCSLLEDSPTLDIEF